MAEPEIKHLYRSEKNRVLAGVAGGIAEYFNTDPVLIRIGFILLTIGHGFGALIYLICWVVIPTQTDAKNGTTPSIQHNIERMAEEIRQNFQPEKYRTTIGIWLIILGLVFLFINLGIFTAQLIIKIWPIILILIGWQLFSKTKS